MYKCAPSCVVCLYFYIILQLIKLAVLWSSQRLLVASALMSSITVLVRRDASQPCCSFSHELTVCGQPVWLIGMSVAWLILLCSSRRRRRETLQHSSVLSTQQSCTFNLKFVSKHHRWLSQILLHPLGYPPSVTRSYLYQPVQICIDISRITGIILTQSHGIQGILNTAHTHIDQGRLNRLAEVFIFTLFCV